MSTAWEPRASSHDAEHSANSVDQTLFRLGQELIAAGPSTGVVAAEPRHYCSFCWSAMAPEAVECADCGETVAAMKAVDVARMEQDRAWVPPSRRAAGDPEPAPRTPRVPRRSIAAKELPSDRPRSAPVEGQPVRAPLPEDPAWKPFATALVVGGAVGAVGGSAVWLVCNMLAGH